MIRELLTKQNIEFAERAREVAETSIRPIAAQHDVEQTYPWSAQKAIKDAGLSGVWIPKEYGGAGGGVLDLCLVVEEISRACGGMGVMYAVNALGSFPIILGGTEAQKRQHLPRITRLAACGGHFGAPLKEEVVRVWCGTTSSAGQRSCAPTHSESFPKQVLPG